MLKLIRLEWKKNNVGKYIRNVVIMSALICLFIFALCYLGIANDPDTGVPDAVPGNSAISSSIELFTSMAFLVFTSVMLSTYIVSAYKNKFTAAFYLVHNSWFPHSHWTTIWQVWGSIFSYS